MKNLTAGFWIRAAARISDLIIVFIVSFLILFANLEKVNNNWHFINNSMFYVWGLSFITILFTWFILIPYLTNGQTLFMKLYRIKIIYKDKHELISLIKREFMYSIYWIFMTLIFVLIINHTLIFEYSIKDQSQFSDWNKFRINIFTSVGMLGTVIQFIFSISIAVRKNKDGLHDKISNTETIWINKYVEVEEKEEIVIKPRLVKNEDVIWV